MIFVSSSCVKNSTIEESVSELSSFGFKNIELSGGTQYRDHKQLIKNLILLKKEGDLNYIIHNYFPPPKKAFVLNLASNDSEVSKLTIEHILNCIDYSNQLESSKLGFHAGFFFNLDLKEIGKKITATTYSNFEKAKDVFIERYLRIKEVAKKKGVNLYLENNVYSDTNSSRYGLPAPAMLLSKEDYHSLRNEIEFNLLLDLAHLNVSSKTLNLDFKNQSLSLIKETDYIHLSNNNGLEDQNKAFTDSNSSILEPLRTIILKDKTITLEIYEDLHAIKKSFEIVDSIS